MKILIASHNEGKINEVKNIALKQNFMCDFISLKDLNISLDAVEDANTFAGNAEKKARFYYNLTKIPCLADDSGLCCKGLSGAPGVNSARFYVDHDDYQNMLYLVEQLAKKSKKAYFACAMVYFDGNQILKTQGKLQGVIIDKPLGQNGFGYDPVFYIKKFKTTLANISEEEKNKVSHRFIATKKILKKLFKSLK